MVCVISALKGKKQKESSLSTSGLKDMQIPSNCSLNDNGFKNPNDFFPVSVKFCLITFWQFVEIEKRIMDINVF